MIEFNQKEYLERYERAFEKGLVIYKAIKDSGLTWTDDFIVSTIMECVITEFEEDVASEEKTTNKPKKGDWYKSYVSGRVREITEINGDEYTLTDASDGDTIKVSSESLAGVYVKWDAPTLETPPTPTPKFKAGDRFSFNEDDELILNYYKDGNWQYTFTKGICTGSTGYVDEKDLSKPDYTLVTPDTIKVGDRFKSFNTCDTYVVEKDDINTIYEVRNESEDFKLHFTKRELLDTTRFERVN